jgi:hypothetical protein
MLSIGQARESLFQNERCDSARAGIRIGFGVDHKNAGVAAIGNPHSRDDVEVMLDHQDGVFRRDALDQRGDLVDVLMAHAGHRFIEQHHFRIERQRGGDLQRALAAIGHLDRRSVGEFAEADVFEQFGGALIVLVEHALGAPKIE